MSLGTQIVWLFVLAVPVACIAWTVTHEDVFLELREYFMERSRKGRTLLERKFFYLLTCEYCFSHYAAIFILAITRYKLLYPDWRGYLVAGFALVWVANQYMSGFGRLRLDIRRERVEIKGIEQEVKEKEKGSEEEEHPRLEKPAA
jgi:hypothetical protein